MTRRMTTWILAPEFRRYFAISLAALGVDFGVLLVAAMWLHYLLAATLGFMLGAVTSYVLAVRWAFGHRRLAHRPRTEFVAYTLVGIAGLGINNLVIFLAVEYLSLSLVVGKAIAAGVTFAFNYLGRKATLFSK